MPVARNVQSLQHHHEPRGDPRSLSRRQPLRRQPRTDAWCVSGLSGVRHSQCRRRSRACDDAVGHAASSRTGGAPVTNIRNTSSPHWRMWLKPESRCLVPFNSFAEYAPEPNPETKEKDVVWFALSDDRPLAAFAEIWTHSKATAAQSRSRSRVHTTSTASSQPRRTQWSSQFTTRQCP